MNVPQAAGPQGNKSRQGRQKRPSPQRPVFPGPSDESESVGYPTHGPGVKDTENHPEGGVEGLDLGPFLPSLAGLVSLPRCTHR